MIQRITLLALGLLGATLACGGPVIVRPLRVVCSAYTMSTYQYAVCTCMQMEAPIVVRDAAWDVDDEWYVRYGAKDGQIVLYATAEGSYTVRCTYRPDDIHVWTGTATLFVHRWP